MYLSSLSNASIPYPWDLYMSSPWYTGEAYPWNMKVWKGVDFT